MKSKIDKTKSTVCELDSNWFSGWSVPNMWTTDNHLPVMNTIVES